MSLVDQLNSALIESLRQRDRLRTAALRLIIAAVKNKEIEKRAPLEDDEVIALLRTEAKKRQESEAIYRQAGRQELAERELLDLKIISGFLPAQMDEAQITKAVLELKAAGEWGDNFGTAMKQVMAKLKGQAEGKLVAEIVKAEL